jgi:L-threonylcarbamoyladenylate synthase
MDTHYAPRKNLYLLPREEFLSKIEYSTDKLFIAFTKECQKVNKGNVLMLSENEDLDEAAYNLFSVLRKADESTSAEIIAELVPDNGLGLAINDRLRRASVRK